MLLRNSLKSSLISLINFGVRNKQTWPFFKAVIHLAECFRYQRSLYEHINATKELEKAFSDRMVRSGFFKGLRYPSFQSVGSSLPPKLLGSYEVELHPVFKEIQKNHYTEILNIGCAEGFYAVGLAIKFPQAKVFAFDVDETTLGFCKRMAEENSVSERVILNGICDETTLKNFYFSGRALIICDCEGYEKSLFTADNLPNLTNCDFIIELHPMYCRDIRNYLTNLFQYSHKVSFITSYDDKRKLFDYADDLKELSELARLKCIQEGRSFSMDWMILMAK